MKSHEFIQDIINILRKHNLTIATCESVTGGMIVSHLIDVSGSSDVVKGGIISYANEIKIKNVGVNKNTIEKYGAVSSNVAIEMAKGISTKMNCDIALAITGNAGPKNIENKKCGLAYLCIKVIDKTYQFELQSNEKERNNIRIDLTIQSLVYLQNLLKRMDK
jgi:PncC family amidohydrolase